MIRVKASACNKGVFDPAEIVMECSTGTFQGLKLFSESLCPKIRFGMPWNLVAKCDEEN
jgi:hypothetical protein